MKNWQTKPLFELCSPKQWPTISGSELTVSGFPVYGANGQIGYYHTYNHEVPTILITCRGATCGTLNISPPKAYVTGNAMALDNPNLKIIDFRFLYYALLGRGLKDTITGAAQPQITRANLSSVVLPVPSLPEQERIVKLLDEADELRKLRAKADTRTAQLVPALFHEMFGDPSRNPKDCKIVRLEEVTTRITDGVHQKPNYVPSGVPFISVKNISTGTLLFDDCKFITDADHKKYTKRCKPEYLDILYTKVGTYGRPALIETEQEFSIYVSVCLIKPIKNIIDSHFLAMALSTPALKGQADRSVKGIGVPDLHLDQIQKFVLPLPPLPLQKEFAKRVTEIKEMETAQVASRRRLDDLFQSMLHRAFNGDL